MLPYIPVYRFSKADSILKVKVHEVHLLHIIETTQTQITQQQLHRRIRYNYLRIFLVQAASTMISVGNELIMSKKKLVLKKKEMRIKKKIIRILYEYQSLMSLLPEVMQSTSHRLGYEDSLFFIVGSMQFQYPVDI